MSERIHLYVDSVHSVGGVITWAFQVSTLLNRFDARVVTVNRTQDDVADAHLFPGPRISLYSGRNSEKQRTQLREQADQSVEKAPLGVNISYPTIPTKPTIPTLPSKRIQPTSPTQVHSEIREREGKRPSLLTKVTKETKPTKPTLPTKPTILGHELVHSWDDLDEFVRSQVSKTTVFVPNYLEVGYRHAALSRVQGLSSRCIGICHTDHKHYYDFLVRYERIIQTFITVSAMCKRRLCELIPHRENDIHFLPYGVDSFGPRRVHCEDKPIRLVYAGRLVNDQKRIMDLVKVVAALDQKGYEYLLHFIGVGRDSQELINAVEGMPSVKVFDGVSQPRMMELYLDYDVLLLASETEGMSIAMLESMARGVVPIVTRVSGSEEVIVDGANGFICEVGDVSLMTQRICELGCDRGLLVKMSRSAYETVRIRYSTGEHIKGFNELIDATLQKPLVSTQAALCCLRGEARVEGSIEYDRAIIQTA